MYFGVSTLLDAASSDSPKAEDEQKEVRFFYFLFKFLQCFVTFMSWKNLTWLNVIFLHLNQAELAISKFSGNGAGILSVANTVISTFFLVFIAEWGDKSFFSTIGESQIQKPVVIMLCTNNIHLWRNYYVVWEHLTHCACQISETMPR